MLHRSRQLLVCQRTMLSNAIRGHMAELGIISAKGRNGTAELLEIIADEQDDRIPAAARFSLDVLARQYAAITAEIGAIEKRIHAWHRSCEESRRLEEIPGVGPIVATALVAEVGDWKAFSSGRSLAAWIGLVPQTAFDRRQREARQDLKAGQSTFAMVARRWRDGCHPICAPARHKAALARASDGPSADQSRCRCTCQQNRTDGLGHDGARRAVQGAEVVAGRRSCQQQAKVTTNWRGHDDVMQIRSFRGSGEPAWVIASSNACVGLGPDPRRALGPAAIRAASNRPDT